MVLYRRRRRFVNRLALLDKYISSWYNDIYEIQEARMLEYSKAAFHKIVNNVKRLTYVCNVAMQAVMVVYLIYATATGSGKMWANISLLTICLAYFIFFLITTKCNPFTQRPVPQKHVQRAVQYTKLCIRLCSLGVSLYGVYVATTHVTGWSIILTILSLLTWLLQVILEVIKYIVEDVAKLLKDAVEADVETIMKPVTTVKNFFKKATGQEIEPAKEKSKHRLWLDEQVQKMLAERKAKKLEMKRAKSKKKRQSSKEEQTDDKS
jgi:hypothetical protein